MTLQHYTLYLLLVLLCVGGTTISGQDAEADYGLYEPVTFSVTVDSGLYDNPFDTSDIEVLGIFQPESGNQQVISGFWMQPYDADMQPVGEPGWYVRFTPQETGAWTYSLQMRDSSGLVQAEDGRFNVGESDRKGFIRVGSNGRYFQYANGEPYFPIGHNLKWSWSGAGGLETYLEWLRDLSASGGNYARLFIDVPWFINLDWAGPAGDYRDAQLAAAQLDRILEMAAEYDIALQLVLQWHQSILIYNGPPVIIPERPPRPQMSLDWDDHPYNILNGGPLSGPGVFLYSDVAENLLRRRLHYIVARWGFSPQIMAWEIIDRIDRVSNYEPQVAGDWLQRTSNYLRRIDQNRHLITAGSRDFSAVIAENPFLDFATAQYYQRRPIETVYEQVTGAVDLVRRQLSLNPIPMLITDYSLNPWYEPLEDDPSGVHFQTTLWATALAGSAGGAMSDWWETYVIPRGLTMYYAPLAAFAAGIDWPGLNLEPAEAGLLMVAGDAGYGALRLNSFNRQFLSPMRDVMRRDVTADGVFPDLEGQPSYLYGDVFNRQFSQAQLYRVTPPVDTYLEIGIRSVSTQAGARLVVTVDNQTAAELELRAGARDSVIRIPLAAGERNIMLDNIGSDWLELDYIEIGEMISPARALTLRDSEAGIALSWVQHRDYTWEQVNTGAPREPVMLRYQLNRMLPGLYVAEIWDPLSGGVVGEEIVQVEADGLLVFDLLPLDSMLAVRVFHQPDEDMPDIAEPVPAATAAPDVTAPVLVPQTNTPQPDVTAP